MKDNDSIKDLVVKCSACYIQHGNSCLKEVFENDFCVYTDLEVFAGKEVDFFE